MITEEALDHLNKPLNVKVINHNYKMMVNKDKEEYVVKVFFPKILVLRVSKSKFLEVFEKLSISNE